MSIKSRLGRVTSREDTNWQCQVCSTQNKHNSKLCTSCSTSQNNHGSITWKCSRCNSQNGGFRNDCANCGISRRLAGRLAGIKPPGAKDHTNNQSRSWICSKCGAKVYGKRTDCFKCHTPKVSAEVDPDPTNTGPWRCVSCDTVNSGGRDTCGNCDASVEKNQDFRTGDWQCSQCCFMNFARRTECLRCEKVREDADVSHEGEEAGSSHERKYMHDNSANDSQILNWKCYKCQEINAGYPFICSSCGEPNSWICKQCRSENDITNLSCSGCHQGNPTIEADPVETDSCWQCEYCNTSNSVEQSFCSTCKDNDTNDDDWICSLCNYKNNQLDSHCSNCEEGCKPGNYENLYITVDSIAESSFEEDATRHMGRKALPPSHHKYEPPSKRRKTLCDVPREFRERQDSYWTCRFCNIIISPQNGDCPKCHTAQDQCSLEHEVTRILPMVSMSNISQRQFGNSAGISMTPKSKFSSHDELEAEELTVSIRRTSSPTHNYKSANQRDQCGEGFYEKTYIFPDEDDQHSTSFSGHWNTSYGNTGKGSYEREGEYSSQMPTQEGSNQKPRRTLLETPTLQPNNVNTGPQNEGYECPCGNYNRISDEKCLRCGRRNSNKRTKLQGFTSETVDQQKHESEFDSSETLQREDAPNANSKEFWYCKYCYVANNGSSITCYECRQFKSEVSLPSRTESASVKIARRCISDIKLLLPDAKRAMAGIDNQSAVCESVLGYVLKMCEVMTDPSLPYDELEDMQYKKASQYCRSAVDELDYIGRDSSILKSLDDSLSCLQKYLGDKRKAARDGKHSRYFWNCQHCQHQNTLDQKTCLNCHFLMHNSQQTNETLSRPLLSAPTIRSQNPKPLLKRSMFSASSR